MSERLTTEKLVKILESHGKWLRDEEGEERADLRDANLIGADLRSANLSSAKNLKTACIWNTNLSEAKLDGRWVVIAQIGSRKGTTYYDEDNAIIRCGCFIGTLAEFTEAVERTHGDHPQYLPEYRAAIAYIKAICEIDKAV